MMWSRWAFVGAFVILLADGAAALAADPPGRVGRVSFVDGTVSMRADMGEDSQDPEWRAATVNYPVTTGNSLWTDNGGKAEVQVGPAEVRLDRQTELEVMRLDDNAVDLALHQGTVNVHLGSELPGGLRIDTPRGPVRLTRPGSYRIGVDTSADNANDAVELTAFDGEAEIEAISDNRSATHRVGRGQSVKIANDVVLADARLTPFDQWAKSRDPGVVMPQQAQNPSVGGTVQPIARPVQQTTQYVSPQATGYQDLAGYGTWEQAPNYGAVWYPTAVVADWQPYRYGHWEYIRPWGWTWIDDAPWGFTPFHYGRWVRVGPRWAWWPGQRAVRPVYAPALVAFVGGNGWSVSITSGRARPVGWVPLAPYEVYRPHYRTSATYIRNVNVTTVNKTVINNITVNKNVEINKMVNRNAATVVSADSFRRGQKANEAKIDVPRREFDKARVSNDVRRIAPERVAARAEAPRPAARKEDNIRRPDPGIVARDQQQPRGQNRDQAREQTHRDQRDQRRDQPAERRDAAPQNQAQERQRRDQEQEQRRSRDQEQEQRRSRDQAQEQRQRRDQTEQERQSPQRDQAPQDQRRQREAQDQQRRDQVQQQERQQRDQAQDQQQRQREAQDQQRREAQDQQRREQVQQQERQQRDQAEQQQRRQRDVQERQQRDQAQQEQRRQRDVQERQQRDQAEQQQRREQARQQREQQQREQQQRQRDQQSQMEQQQRRQQAEQQQRQAQEQNQRRQQAEAQQRAQAEQQQRQAQEQQQRQQRDQAQQQQQRQQQEQAREEQRRRGQEKREERKERAG